MDLADAFLLFYCFAMDFSISQAFKMLKTLARSSVVRFYVRMTQLLTQNRSDLSLYGIADEAATGIVEIDESLFGRKRKYNKGRYIPRQWVFGIVERGSRKTFFKVVNDRSSDTLVPLIRSWVTPGSTIYSDDWRSYRNLQDFGYKHGVVVHTREFVSQSGVCTNTIEGQFDTRNCRFSVFLIK